MRSAKQPYRPKKNNLIGGYESLLRALKEGTQLERIYVDSRASAAQLRELRRLSDAHAVPLNTVPTAKLDHFNLHNHGGFIAIRSRINYLELSEIISSVFDRGESPLLLILDGITDIRNIGAIARTAYCCGAHALIIPDKGVGMLNEDAIHTSAGALEKLAVTRVNSLVKTIDELHHHGIKVYASEMKQKQHVFQCDLSIPCAIILGSEDKGVYPALMKVADEKFSIPMHHDFESLNVGAAAAMILYEALRQRM